MNPYSPDEMAVLLKKDPRLHLNLAMIAQQKNDLAKEMQRLHMFLYTAIMKTGRIEVTPSDMVYFKDHFENFIFNREGTSFTLDVPRIIVAPEPPNGTKGDEPIIQ
jgi:hypothetical protein